MAVDTTVMFTGIKFENPFMLSSAPPTESESNILRAFDAGWGGVVTKTIGLHPVVNVYGAKAKFMRTSPENAQVSMTARASRPALWFVLPALAIYLLIVIYPSLAGAVYAFTNWSGVGDTREFIGLDNFRAILSDDQSFGALRNTVFLTVFIVVVQNFVGFLLALGVHTRIKSRHVLRTILFAPAVVSPVVLAFLWKYLFNPAPDSGLNALLGFIGLGALRQNWLGDPAWRCGRRPHRRVAVRRLLDGDLPRRAAGRTAGSAGRLRTRRRRALRAPAPRRRPADRPGVHDQPDAVEIGGLKLFDQVFAITNGGPGYATETLSTLTYKQAFVFGHYGYSTAIALVLALLVAASRWSSCATCATARWSHEASLHAAHVRSRALMIAVALLFLFPVYVR